MKNLFVVASSIIASFTVALMTYREIKQSRRMEKIRVTKRNY